MVGKKCPSGSFEICSDKCEWFMEEEQTCCMKVAVMPIKSKSKPRKKKED